MNFELTINFKEERRFFKKSILFYKLSENKAKYHKSKVFQNQSTVHVSLVAHQEVSRTREEYAGHATNLVKPALVLDKIAV